MLAPSSFLFSSPSSTPPGKPYLSMDARLALRSVGPSVGPPDEENTVASIHLDVGFFRTRTHRRTHRSQKFCVFLRSKTCHPSSRNASCVYMIPFHRQSGLLSRRRFLNVQQADKRLDYITLAVALRHLFKKITQHGHDAYTRMEDKSLSVLLLIYYYHFIIFILKYEEN